MIICQKMEKTIYLSSGLFYLKSSFSKGRSMNKLTDNLHIEIELFNSELDDATPALIWLVNELIENGTIEISEPLSVNTHRGNNFEVRWWFTED